MKTKKIFMSILAAGALTTACNDLDQLPNSSYVTDGQKTEAAEAKPELAAASCNALPAQLNQYYSIFGNHIDFGWSSVIISIETRGQDMPSEDMGYNWYSPALSYEDFGGRYYLNLLYWYYNYYTIRSANSLVKTLQAPSTGELKYYRAQGLAFRGFCYFNLAQMYQFTYAKDPQALCVPVITDVNMDEVAADGCKASTVAEVYAQVLSDYTEAIQLLTEAENEDCTRESLNSSAALAKSFVNLATVYGLRARAHQFMTNWAAAEADATKAIELASAEGYSPYTIQEASVPAFWNILDHNTLWGMYANPDESRYKGIVNYASHFTGFQTNGYAGAGPYRKVSKKLYNMISNSDCRKKWWLDGNGATPSSLPSAYADLVNGGYESVGNEPFPPYAQLKIGNYEDTPSTTGAVSNPLLRIEELYLIKAEAEGMQNPAKGATSLVNFVKTYRNPSYEFTAGSAAQLQDEVWFQRRVELWGEGFAYWDLMRLQKGVDRVGAGFDGPNVFVVAPDNTVLLYDIPEAEIQRNPILGRTANGSSIPTPVDDVE